MKESNPLNGDRAAIAYDNSLEKQASEKRWIAYNKGQNDAKNNKSFNLCYFTNEDEKEMYKIGWNNIKGKFLKAVIQNKI